MKKLLLFALPFILFSSCIQEGCTDPGALNYSSSAVSDDGSCILEQDIQNLYVENFTLSFDNSTSLDFYTPNFIYEVGDMIINDKQSPNHIESVQKGKKSTHAFSEFKLLDSI